MNAMYDELFDLFSSDEEDGLLSRRGNEESDLVAFGEMCLKAIEAAKGVSGGGDV